MKSICIKTNDTHLLNYLLNEFDYIEIDKVCISTNQFKNYKNIIIHYTGNEISAFIHEVSCILSCFVIDEIEESILKRLILKNYFYFEAIERREILDVCYDIFTDEFNEYFDKKYNCLINDFSSYLTENKSIILSGFINFRIKDYVKILEDVYFNPNETGFLFVKDHQALQEKVDAVLAEMKEDGRLKELAETYFQTDISVKSDQAIQTVETD